MSWIGFAAILLLPFRIGGIRAAVHDSDAARKGTTDARGRVTGQVTMSAATASTIVAERIVDGLYLSIVLVVALLTVPTIQPMPDKRRRHPCRRSRRCRRRRVRSGSSLFAGGFPVHRRSITSRATSAHRATLATFGLVSRPLGEKLAWMAENLADGLHVSSGARATRSPFLVETTLYWALNAPACGSSRGAAASRTPTGARRPSARRAR